MLKFLLSMIIVIMSCSSLLSAPLVSYTKLSDEAKKLGEIEIYNDIPKINGTLDLDEYYISYKVPKNVRAYDCIPIEYTISIPKSDRRIAFEAVAFEDEKRLKKPAFDLAIPGNLNVTFDYLGSVSGDYEPDIYPYLQKDPKEGAIMDFVPIKRDELVKSGVIRAADCVWFKFRLTNTGDTILDPEGFGASMIIPYIMKIDENGKNEWEHAMQPINLFERHLDYIYPGESYDFWTQFDCSKAFGWPGRQLLEGNYVVTIEMGYRYNQTYNYDINVWGSKPFVKAEVPIVVSKEAKNVPVTIENVVLDDIEKMPGYLSSFEEFMTSFDYFDKSEKENKITKTMYLQVAPWTKNITLKLILTDPKKMVSVNIPVNVTEENMKIKYNPDNQMIVNNGGVEEPVILAMALPGMRQNFQLGPDLEDFMTKEAYDMKALGVNVISNTAGGYWYGELGRFPKERIVEPLEIGYRYWYDNLMRKIGLKCLGWSVYPGNNPGAFDVNNAYKGENLEFEKLDKTYANGGVDYFDPNLPKAIAGLVEYTYGRWGDYWYVTKDGKMPIEMEDSWGWMRYDINERYPLTNKINEFFQKWAIDKYEHIEEINKAWNANFSSINEIDIEKIDMLMIENWAKENYRVPDPIFYEWSPAMLDYDVFRTEMRMKFLDNVNKEIQKVLSNGEISVRTEGANLIAKGDEFSNNSDMRHVYYSQRRNAMEYKTLQKADVLHFYNDYTTIAYSREDWRLAHKESKEANVTTMYLAQFNHMRDIFMNSHYGRDYSVHYNLSSDFENKKGMMIHCLQAAYPLWKIAYEEGGCAGIIWADYLCDGFATETQKKEVKLLSENFKKMKK